MMSWRLRKQIFYLLVLGIILTSIVLLFLNFFKKAESCSDGIQNQGEEGVDCGGPCLPCDIVHLQPIKVYDIKIVKYPNKTMDVVGIVENPNDNYGLKKFSYQFLFKGKNNEMVQISGSTFILPRERKYIIEINRNQPWFEIDKVELLLDYQKEDWQKIINPIVDIEMLNYKINQNENIFESEIVNSSGSLYKRVFLSYLLLNKKEEIIGVLTTYLGYIEPLERRKITLPLPPLEDVTQSVLFYPTADLFEQ